MGIILAVVLLVLVGWNYGFDSGLATATFTLIAAVILFSRQRSNARRQMKQTCSCVDRAVSYEGWDGTIHSFVFESTSYTQLFVELNRKKILDLERQA